MDFGIIAGALLYLDKTVNVTEGELSFVVAMYSIGGFAASLVAGMCADWIGRKKMMIAGGLMFAGTPDQVYDQVVDFYQAVGGFGHFLMMSQAGQMGHEDTVESMTLFAREVMEPIAARQ